MPVTVVLRGLLAAAAVAAMGVAAWSAQGAEGPYRWPDGLRGANIILGRITEPDLDHLASDWKANSVRLMAGRLLAEKPPYTIDTARLQKLYQVVDRCRERGLYVVINLGQPAGRRDSGLFWREADLQRAFVQLWVTIARHYARSGPGLAYDLMNEPHGKAAREVWPGLVRRLTAAVREADPRHPIVIEPAPWGGPGAFADLEPLTDDPNTVYSFHFYDPFDFTHQRGAAGILKATPEEYPGGLRYPGPIKPWWEGAKTTVWNRHTIRERVEPVVEFRRKYGVAVWVGEFGCTRWADGAYQWFSDCLETWEELGFGWAYYSYREWYAMDLEQGTEDRSRNAPRYESELVKLFKRYFARNAQATGRGPEGEQ